MAALDGLRGLAALIVVGSHASSLGMDLLPGLALTGTGKYGVYLFFVLSAYLLSKQWLQAWERGQADGAYLSSYLVKRVLRIYPLYTLVLLAGLALAPKGLGVSLDAPAVWRHFTLQEGRDIYWSIPVEFLYYLCLPVVTWVLALRLHWVSKLAFAIASLGAVQWFYPSQGTPLNSANLAYYLPIFICGSMAAWCMQAMPVTDDRCAAKFSWIDMLPVAMLLLSVPQVFDALGWHAGVDALHRSFLVWGAFWSLLLLGMLRGWLPLWSSVLSHPAWRACGRWCFGLYLLHMPVLYVVRKLPMPALVQAWLALALAIALAAAVHRLIEAPAMRLARR